MSSSQEKTAMPHDTLLMPVPEPKQDVAIELPEYGWDEIITHNKPRDLWIVVGGNIYNIGEFMYHHPGGAEIFLEFFGKDATDEFLQIGHPEYAMRLTASFLVGKVKPGSEPPKHSVPPHSEFQGTYSDPNQQKPAAYPEDKLSIEKQPIDHIQNGGPMEIPKAVTMLKMKGERYLNFDILNNVLSQLDYYKEFGHIYQVPLPGGGRIVVCSDPELLDEIAGNNEQFGKKAEGINFFQQLANSRGSGISVISDSPFYDKVRRIMLPWYSPAHQRTQFSRMKDVAMHMMKGFERIPIDTPLDMREWGIRYSLEISGRGACSYDFKILDLEAEKSEFAKAIPESLKEAVARVAEANPDKKPLIGGDPELIKRSEKFHKQSQILFENGEKIVNTRMNTVPLGEQTDLLSRLITEKDPETGEKLDTETIRDQILMHLSNGFNGPSVTFPWICYMLAIHAEVEEKVISEIDAITGGDADYDLQYADLLNMKYITQVIKETLRIYPPMPITIRNSLKDGSLGKYKMQKDDIIFIGTLAAQRDPRYWGEKPEVFDPENFALEKVLTRHRHAFIPFSVGVRQCMAQEVTFMMLRIGVFYIWNKYRLRIVPGAKVNLRTVVTMSPASVNIIRKEREPKEVRQTIIEAELAAIKKYNTSTQVYDKSDMSWDLPSEIAADNPFKYPKIAFGSNFGTCKDLAERLLERSKKYGFLPDIQPLNNMVDKAVQTTPWLLLVATATYTSNPPSNANKFKAWLDKQEPCETWQNCRFVLFGLGNSQWNAFLHFPKYVYKRLGELGAKPLHDMGAADVSSPDWENTFMKWGNEVWPILIDLAHAKPSERAAAMLAEQQIKNEELKKLDSQSALTSSLDGKILAPEIFVNSIGIETFPAKIIVTRELHSAEAPNSTHHLEISIPDGFKYTAGDHLGICPQNDRTQVAKLAYLLQAPLEGIFVVPQNMKVKAVPRGVPLQVSNVLTNLVNISAAPTVPMLHVLHDNCVSDDEKATLMAMKQALEGKEGAEAEQLRKQLKSGLYNIVELLDRFQGCDLNFFQFLEIADVLRPRYYSTSSCPEIHGNQNVHITVGKLVLPIQEVADKNFYGISSNYIHSLKTGDTIDIFLDEAEGFHIQEDIEKPMIMVSAGTGYAPMRAFLFERLAMAKNGTKMGKALLFNGIRNSKQDFIYEEEFDMFKKAGVLENLYLAKSRETPDKKEYVQHKIEENAAEVWDLMQKGSYIYICGSQQMRNDVHAAFAKCVQDQGSMSYEEAIAYLANMEETEKRYRPDVWG